MERGEREGSSERGNFNIICELRRRTVRRLGIQGNLSNSEHPGDNLPPPYGLAPVIVRDCVTRGLD